MPVAFIVAEQQRFRTFQATRAKITSDASRFALEPVTGNWSALLQRMLISA
jgi:hypothetical protein